MAGVFPHRAVATLSWFLQDGSLALVVSLWQLPGGSSLALVVPLGQVPLGGLLAMAVPPGWLVSGGSFLSGVFPPLLDQRRAGMAGAFPCHAVAGLSWCLLGDSLALVVPLWQLLGGGTLALAVLLRQVPFGGLLASAVPSGWLFGGGSFLPGVSHLGSAFARRHLFASSHSCLHFLFSPVFGLWGYLEA